ncbi:MAG TPA: twin-arginine translocase TatA/TatE family subunit [Dehalococcoidia bacterium]|nr:twin-arginine translocase TatA/TatE family subunit [Dehalococcoidia bacterium]
MIRPGPLEIGLILVIILIVFGVGKLPQVGAALGKSINAFRRGQKGEDEEEGKDKKKTTKKRKPAKKGKKTTQERVAEVEAEGATETKTEEKA